MQWEEQVYVDTALPFGLRSAPKIFTAIADALEWILTQHGMSSCLHYLDDFLTMGPPGSRECEHNLQLLLQLCEKLGIPIAIHKVEGPTTILIFLGIEFDRSNDNEATRGKAATTETAHCRMASEEGSKEASTVVTHWRAGTCLQGSGTRKDILTKND